jgi:hypothetical protein
MRLVCEEVSGFLRAEPLGEGGVAKTACGLSPGGRLSPSFLSVITLIHLLNEN